MKILIHSLNFYPDLTGIGKYSAEMAIWFALRGHRVEVITAPPYYPNWKLSPKYRRYFWSFQAWSGIYIWRCPIYVMGKPSGLHRIFQALSFAFSAVPILIYQITQRPDIMITIGPPLFAAPFASLIGKLIGAKTILHIQDYEVDAAFNFGLIRGNLLKNLALSIEKRILLSFNRVSTISLGMMRLAQEKGVAKSRLLFFPNWIDMKPFMDTSSDTINARSPQVLNYRELLKIPENSIIALYSGAMGIKQALHLLAVVAKLFQKDSALSQSVYFIFCGEGPGKSDLEIACSGLRNVFFLDFQPNKHLPTLLMQADIHLLPQRNDVSDLMMPSKLTGMLASGRPIVACAKKETDLEVIIKSCGIAVSPDNPYEFYAAVRNLALDIRLREHLGANGKNYAIKNLSKENILCKFETEIQNLASKTYQS